MVQPICPCKIWRSSAIDLKAGKVVCKMAFATLYPHAKAVLALVAPTYLVRYLLLQCLALSTLMSTSISSTSRTLILDRYHIRDASTGFSSCIVQACRDMDLATCMFEMKWIHIHGPPVECSGDPSLMPLHSRHLCPSTQLTSTLVRPEDTRRLVLSNLAMDPSNSCLAVFFSTSPRIPSHILANRRSRRSSLKQRISETCCMAAGILVLLSKLTGVNPLFLDSRNSSSTRN